VILVVVVGLVAGTPIVDVIIEAVAYAVVTD
jgi:hypothetical protein